MAKLLLVALGIAFCLFLLTSCHSGPTVATEPTSSGTMTIEFEWSKENLCNRGVSPQIVLHGVPPATARFKASLKDLQMMSYNHGGGVYENDGSGIIPRGALKNYRGPCPPMGAVHRYRFTVQALDAAGAVLAQGEKTVPCNRAVMTK